MLQVYTGCSKYTEYTRVHRVYKVIQLYQSIRGIQEYKGYAKKYKYTGIQGCTTVGITVFGTIHGGLHDIMTLGNSLDPPT